MPVETVHLIAAARPNFMKVAPLWHALKAAPDFAPFLVHTGQHYDSNMSDQIWADLDLPEPDFHLGVGSGSHAEQTGRVMIAYGEVAEAHRPDWLVVVGDVNSTLACAITGVKAGIRTVHLEAGLRSRDRSMPEEINRIATDSISDILWTPSPDADENLLAEGVSAERISRVGNIMIDSFEMRRAEIERAQVAAGLGYNGAGYAVATFHRPANVDDPAPLGQLVDGLIALQASIPIVFPVHPRTAARLAADGLTDRLARAGVRLVEPQSYVRFMSLVSGARAVVTDSGGIQEETTYLGIPCITVRETTERPITIDQGTNKLAGIDHFADSVVQALALQAGAGGAKARPRPEYWDGATAGRCVEDLRRRRG